MIEPLEPTLIELAEGQCSLVALPLLAEIVWELFGCLASFFIT